MRIAMALLRTLGPERLDEFMVYNNKSKQTSYYKVGEEFDGGRHNRGLLIKAATYHNLCLKQSKVGWEAEVVFDI